MNSPFKSMTPGFIKRSDNKSAGGIDPESKAEGSIVKNKYNL